MPRGPQGRRRHPVAVDERAGERPVVHPPRCRRTGCATSGPRAWRPPPSPTPTRGTGAALVGGGDVGAVGRPHPAVGLDLGRHTRRRRGRRRPPGTPGRPSTARRARPAGRPWPPHPGGCTPRRTGRPTRGSTGGARSRPTPGPSGPASRATTSAKGSRTSSWMDTYENPYSSRRSISVSHMESTVPASTSGTSSASSAVTPKYPAMPSTSGSGSSVNCTMAVRQCSSMSSKRSPAASLTQATFCSGGVAQGRAGGVGADLARAQRRVDAHDLGLAPGDRQHPLGPATDEERRVRALRGQWLAVELGHRVVPPRERERPLGHEPLDDPDALLHPFDADRRLVVGRSRRARSRPSSSRRRCRARAGRRTGGRGWRTPWPARPGACSRCRTRARRRAAWWWPSAAAMSAGTTASGQSTKWSGTCSVE